MENSCTELQRDLVRWLTNAPDLSANRAFHTFEGHIDNRPFRLAVWLSAHFARQVHKSTPETLRHVATALRNARYGFDPHRGRSRGGKDGIFVVSRGYRPRNAMIKKLYDDFFDAAQGRAELRRHFEDLDSIHGVRLVCHHLRLLGFIEVGQDDQRWIQKLVLVDFDRSAKRA